MKNNIQDAYKLLWEQYHKDWVYFVHHALGHVTWSKQREIIRAVQLYPRVAVSACHGGSKTFTAAEILVTFYNLFSESRIVTTASNFNQVEKLLWPEVRSIYNNSRIQLIGKCLNTEIHDINDPKHLAYGFSTDDPAKAEGAHANQLMFIFDEAKGVPEWVWDAARGAMTGGMCRWLVISTTDGVEIGSQYYNCFQPGSGWHTIHISAFDSPYVTGEHFHKFHFMDNKNLGKFYLEKIPPEKFKIQIATPQYIDDNRDPRVGFGEGTVLWKTKIEGLICEQGSGSIILLSQVNKMHENHKKKEYKPGKLRGGIDVAWGGHGDSTVCWKACGLRILDDPLVISPEDMTETKVIENQVKMIERYYDYNQDYELRVDADGGGIAIVSALESRGWKVIKINNGGKSTGGDIYAQYPDLKAPPGWAKRQIEEYHNRISEIWFETAKIIDEIACPPCDRLDKELTRRKTYGVSGMDTKGRRAIEEKDAYKKNFGSSPDFADSFLYTLCPAEPLQVIIETNRYLY
jgi:hypothetical protein